MDDPSRRFLRDLLSLPTAPFAEHVVLDYIRRFVAEHPSLTLATDPSGNLLIELKRGPARERPVCLTAHVDHPGFVSERMIGRKKVRAFWRGAVPADLFKNQRLRFWSEGRWVKAAIQTVRTVPMKGRRCVEGVTAEVAAPIEPGCVGMWDFPDPRERRGRLHARGCDDLAGGAALLGVLDRLAGADGNAHAYVLFTRAEEVGFVGAIAAAKTGFIPRQCLVVNVETSSARAGATIGGGPVLRVGDKSGVFTPQATAYCHALAKRLTDEEETFTFQRKLMDGGTCEASVFHHFGYHVAGLCLALGNYHNVHDRSRKISPEYIDLHDFDRLVNWLQALAIDSAPATDHDPLFAQRLEELETRYRDLLRNSVHEPC